ncbi:MAG: hypothetical protein JWM77_4172 [Rhodospirillales bacterium]|jgi:starvation-inducible DNA-binding protein|nr:hypothetical protein [Rhodospirillales bacterium]
MAKAKNQAKKAPAKASPLAPQRGHEIQPYGTLARAPIGLGANVRSASVEALNQLLADTCTLRDLYKKHHWQVSGATFYQLHLLYDKHYEEQSALVDEIAERIQTLGGIPVAMAADIAELTQLPRPPRGREDVPTQISRLLEAHERLLLTCRAAAREAADAGDDGTNDLVVSSLIRTNEMQTWFVSEHLVDTPLVHSGGHG